MEGLSRKFEIAASLPKMNAAYFWALAGILRAMARALPNLDITERDGLFMATFPGCTWQVLPFILNVDVPWIWLHRHMPMRYLEWWRTQTRLSENGPLHDVELRTLTCDVQLSTGTFLEILPEFDRQSIELFQMDRRTPNSLWLEKLPKHACNKILVENGLHLRFYMPHAGEAAFLSMPDRKLLEALVQKPEVRAIAFKHLI